MSEAKRQSVDVVIPTIGRKSLRRAVASALSQSMPVSVFVVLDRPALAGEVVELLEGLRYELTLTDGGMGGGEARNRGFDQGSARYVAFLDDDDWWEPHFLTHRLVAAHAQHQDGADIVFGRFIFDRRDGTSPVVPRLPVPVQELTAVPGYMVTRRSLKFGDHAVQTSSLVMKRAAVAEARWDPSLKKHQDWDLVLRLATRPSATAAWDPHADAHVAQDSPGSVSKKSDWSASYGWWRSRSDYFTPRASADFLATHVLRAALAQRSASGCLRAVSSWRRLPHLAALGVAAAGVLGR